MEARNQQAVTVALKGLVNVYPQNMILVPIKEYVDLLRATKSAETELVPGAYVRLKRGKYGGDLAIVENLSENGLEVRLKLVPRLDYGRNAEAGIDGKRKRVARIPPHDSFLSRRLLSMTLEICRSVAPMRTFTRETSTSEASCTKISKSPW